MGWEEVKTKNPIRFVEQIGFETSSFDEPTSKRRSRFLLFTPSSSPFPGTWLRFDNCKSFAKAPYQPPL